MKPFDAFFRMFRKEEESDLPLRKVRIIFLILLIGFFLLILFFAGIIARRFESEIRRNTITSLENVLHSNHKLLKEVWLKRQYSHATLWASNTNLIKRTKKLLSQAGDSAALVNSPVQKELQVYFKKRMDAYDILGITILDTTGTVLFSYYKNRLGRKAYLYDLYPDRFRKIYRGEKQFLPPVNYTVSDLPKELGDRLANMPIMGIAVPVRGEEGNVIGSLVITKDPFGEFSLIANTARFAPSVETYYIDQTGYMITKSDYKSQKVLLDSASKRTRDNIHIEIRVPPKPKKLPDSLSLANQKRPLTLAAAEVLQHHTGHSLKSYPDFRGTPVLGVWMWDDELGIGLISEIDEREALHPVMVTHRITMIFLGLTFLVTIIIFFFAWKFFTRAGERVRKSLQQFKTLFESSSDAYIIFDKKRVLDCNRAAMNMMGCTTKEEFLQLPLTHLLYGITRTGTLREVKEKVFSQITRTGTYRFESEILKADGETVLPVDVNVTTVLFGSRQVYLASFRDISLQKKAREEVEKERYRLRQILDSSMVVFAFVTEDREVVYANERAKALFGIDEGLLEKRILVNKELRNKLFRKVMYERKEIINYQLQAYDKEGRIIDLLASFFPTEHEGQRSFFTWIVDITDIKKIERELEEAKNLAEAATRAKSDFLARMSHEIRTPMNAIIGLTHLTLHTSLTPQQKVNLQKVHSAAKTLLGILNDILDFSKIEAGKLELEITAFDLEKVFNDLSNIVIFKASQKGLELITSIAPDVPHILRGDPLRLNQILINLTNNAIKFTEKGEIIIRAEKQEEKRNRIKIRFSVRDTGVGLSPEERKKLFKSFSQADVSTTRKYGGSGLGLAISKNLAELMGGTIWVESEKGKGSTFYFTAWFGIEKEQKSKHLITTSEIRNTRVLLVDDNETTLHLLSETLRSFGLKVTTAPGGEEALGALVHAGSDPYHIVILDWYMPGLDGFSLARKIASHPEIDPKPSIIMMSAYDNDDTLKEKVRQDDSLNIDTFLTKPVSYSSLLNAIMKVLGSKDSLPGDDERNELPDKLVSRLRGNLVLLVEDNEVNQDVAVGMLEAAGMRAEIATNGREAVKMVKNSGVPSRFALVLMDLQMPVMDGYDATRAIRRMKEYRDLPILAMTSDAIAGVKEKCLRAGMNDFLTKPIDPDEFYRTLGKYIAEPGNHIPSYVKDQETEKDQEALEQRLHQLQSIHYEEALQRINHNLPLYYKLLRKFSLRYRDFPAELKEKLQKGEKEEARRMVHTLKGVAGNIGAREIHRYSTLLDNKLKKGDTLNITHVADELSRLLTPVIASIEKLLGKTTPQENEKQKDPEADTEELVSLLTGLREMLHEGNFDATVRAEALQKWFSDDSWGTEVKALNGKITSYEFDEAARLADELLKKLKG